jgi:glycosyltransferase involved in cell wall biosynthesis
MIWFAKGWKSMLAVNTKNLELPACVSIVIAVCNGESFVQKTIKQVLRQKHTLKSFELIVVNDYSTDNTLKLIEQLGEHNQLIKTVNNTGTAGKKYALELGRQQAKYPIVLITDIDTQRSPLWLQAMMEHYVATTADFVIGPVGLDVKGAWLPAFQTVEFNSLIASGAGAAGIGHPIMCNGANLAFSKDKYGQLENPFKREVLSGDDVFLLHNFKKMDEVQIAFVKNPDALVWAKAPSSMVGFFKQRARWASKAKNYADGDTLFTGFVVFAMAALLFFSVPASFVSVMYVKPLVFLFVIKTGMDTWFIAQSKTFFSSQKLLPWIPLFELLYPFYIVISAVLGLFKKEW